MAKSLLLSMALEKSPSQPTEASTFLPSSPNPYVPPSPHSLLPQHLWVLHLWFQCRSRWCHRTRESTGCSHFLCISQLPSGLHPSTVQKQKSGSVSEGKKQLHSNRYLGSAAVNLKNTTRIIFLSDASSFGIGPWQA